jgi:lipopolysaccharide export system permease protein
MNRLDRYLLRQLSIAFIFATVAVSFVVLFSQLFRLLELVIDNSGTILVFFKMMGLTVPAFLPIVLPLAFGGATLFVFNKLAGDSELIIMRSVGIAPLRQAMAPLILATIVMIGCAILTLWLTPIANRSLATVQTEVRDNYAVFLSRPGYFNDITDGLTFYAQRRGSNGALENILIHDVRNPQDPTTTMAATGQVVDNNGQAQLVVFSGRRQELDVTTGKLSELAFDQYVLDLNALRNAVSDRMPDAREQTVGELLAPDTATIHSKSPYDHRLAELHQRLATPMLVMSFCLIGLAAILAGEFNRRGLTRRMMAAAIAIIITQATFMSMVGMIAHHIHMAFLLYVVALAPAMASFSLLTFEYRRRPENSMTAPTGALT